MSEVKVNKISPRTACGTVTLGDSGDTFTIPSGATITNAGTASGFGATGETSWDTTVKTTGTFTATAGVGYFLNTTGGIITVNLPVGAAGSSVALADYAATWQTNNVTVAANGTEKIGGVDADVTLSTEGQSVTFVYIDGTQGWVNVIDSTSNVRGENFVVATGGTITTSGNDKIHKFTGPGTFCVSGVAGCATNNLVSYVVTGAGGGGGGSAAITGTLYSGGGAGAGGYREVQSPTAPYTASPLDGYPSAPNRITVSATPYAITVGAGGAGGAGIAAPGPSPSIGQGTSGNTVVFSTITSAGGGGGGAAGGPGGVQPGPTGTGLAGGSGGAGGGYNCSPTGGTGAGNTPPTTPPQGQAGGTGYGPCVAYGGGGGGAGGVGVSAPTVATHNVAGGAGVASQISTAPVTYSAGGNGGANKCSAGDAGGNNTGDGGQGGSDYPACSSGGTGGSGIVWIRYKYK
jgi:hypothetical protein